MRGGMMMSSVGILLLFLLVAEVRGGGFNYRQALELTPLFLYAQRSGKLSDVKNKLVDWRFDSGLTDGMAQGVDLVGGYYDAGDNVKFGLPMAFTMTILSWTALQYGGGGGGIPQDVYANTLDAIKWGTDYLLKAHPNPNVLWVQVGIAFMDHAKWESPENMDTPRDAFKIDETHPGSDVAAETAAALAAASMLFKSTNPSYSQTLISHAVSDELLWAAAWLFRATGKKEYLEYLVSGGAGDPVKEFSWDNKYAGVQVLVSTDDTIWEQSKRIPTNSTNKNGEDVVREYMRRAEYFVCACMQKNAGAGDNVERTPQGLIYVRPWNNLEYSTGAAFLLALYSDHIASSVTCPAGVVTRSDIIRFAQSQADYILGNNRMGMSYLVGYGSKFPEYVHHRGASIPVQYKTSSSSSSSSSKTDWKANPNPNPNILLGAVVGGPDENDKFDDNRGNYDQAEATMNTAATMYGILAKLSSSSSSWNQQQQESVVSVAHAVISTWSVGKTQYCRHRVVLENTSHKDKVKDLRLRIDHLSARPFGLTQVLDDDDDDKNGDDDVKPQIFVLPKWTNATINPRSKHTFVYVQQCAQAKITLLTYTTT
ncbi:unnamed protein product [Cuscuta campestris]|uniref:Endoglucanase n=1 Tax=Cuscuta campestris TaxID=132261 RepID=A0A484LF89_9ASTE|nr:unnamed protein product [Cuscuta campestris]